LDNTQKLIILGKFEESNTIGFTQKHLFNEAIKIFSFNVDEGIPLVSNSLIQSVDTKI
jgi:hypothetical protein